MGSYLISGVSRGIGHAVARRLLDDGHRVYGLARGPVTDLALAGTVTADLTEPAGLAEALGPLLARLTELDGVVHCAGVLRTGPLADATTDDFAAHFTVNVTAAAELTRLLLPALRAAGGAVVLVNSGSGIAARPPLSVYGASKFALRGYADALRAEEPTLRVTTVYPSRTATDMQRQLRSAEGGDFEPERYLQPSTVAGVIASVLALPADGVITELTLHPH